MERVSFIKGTVTVEAHRSKRKLCGQGSLQVFRYWAGQSSFQFFHIIFWKHLNELCGQPSISELICNRIVSLYSYFCVLKNVSSISPVFEYVRRRAPWRRKNLSFLQGPAEKSQKDFVISLSVMQSLFTIIRELPERDSWQKKDSNYQMYSTPSA